MKNNKKDLRTTAYLQDADAAMTTLDASASELRNMHWQELISSEFQALEQLKKLRQKLEEFDDGILLHEIKHRSEFIELMLIQSEKRHYY